MISGNTRSSRSRYSSPAQASQGGGPLEANKNSANEASRAFMRRWMEPAVQNKASYEEAGMVRYGVLENMQPLGSLPKPSAAAKKGAPEGSGSVRRKIILRASGAGGRKNSADGAKVHRAAAAEEAAQSAALNVPQGSSSSSRPSPASIITPSPPPSSLQSSLSPTHSPSLRSPPLRANSSSTPSQRILFSKHSSRDSLEDESAPLEPAPPHSAPSARNSLAMRDPDNDDDYQPKVSMKRSAATRSPAARRSVTRASAGRQSLPSPGAAGTFTASESDDDTEDAAKTRELVGKVVHEAVQAALDHHRYPSAYALSTLYEENRLDPRVMAMFEDVFLQRADADTIDQFTALVSRRKREGAKNNVAHRHWAPSGSPEKSAPAPRGHLLKNDTGDDTPAQKRKKTTHHADSPSLSRPRKASGAEAGFKSGKGIVGTGKDAKAAPTTPTKPRRRSDSMDSDSSLSSVASFDTPSVHGATSLSIVPKPGSEGSRPRPQIKIKARTSQARLGGETQGEQNAKGTGSGSGTVGTRAGGSSGRTATSLDAGVAGAQDDVSGAPGGRQPMAARGKTAVAQQQRKSPPAATGAGAASGASSTKHNNIHPSSSSSTTTTTTTNPVRPGASKTKNRASHSSSPAFSPPDSTLPDHQPPGSRDGAGPDEIASSAKPRDMPGAVAPLFPNLPVKTSGLRTALQSDTPNGDPKKRPSRGSAARTDDPARPRDASVASETRARSETPASARRTRKPAGAASTPAPTGSASRSTRSAVKRAHDEVDGTASPTASTLRSNAPSEAPTRASTPVLPPPSKKQRVGPRVKTS